MREDGHPIPEDWNKPKLGRDCVEYFDAFIYLSERRQWDQGGPLAIPISEIEAYMRIVGVRGTDEKLKMIKLVGQLDDIERNHIFGKMKSK